MTPSFYPIARPDMKRLRLNISWKDEVFVDHPNETICVQTKPPIKLVTDSENVCSQYPKLLCVGTLPPAVAVMEVPFKLLNVTAVRKKPHGMSYKKKKKWLKAELQGLLELCISDQPHWHLRHLSRWFSRTMIHIGCALTTGLWIARLTCSHTQCQE